MGTDIQPPEACSVVAHIPVATSEIFWRQAFIVGGEQNAPRACDAAREGQFNICVLSLKRPQ
jgi:hypothetical protein